MNHASAFSLQTVHGNPVSAAAGVAVLATIEGDGLVDNAERVGAVLCGCAARPRRPPPADRRRPWAGSRHRRRNWWSGDDRSPAKKETAKVVYRAFELGLVLYYVGVGSNVLEMTPPLTLTEAEALEGVAILDRALSDVEAGRVDDDTVQAFAGW